MNCKTCSPLYQQDILQKILIKKLAARVEFLEQMLEAFRGGSVHDQAQDQSEESQPQAV